jgi:hypothetical protein
MSSNYSFLQKADNKQCFCIDPNSKDAPYILDNLKLQMQPHNSPSQSSLTNEIDDSFDYMITPQIYDSIHTNPKDDKRLQAMNELLELALKKLDESKNVKPINEKVDVAPRDSMTVHRHTDKVAINKPDVSASVEVDSDDDSDVDLNTMARTTNKMQRRAGNLGLFEDFNNCNDYCSKNPIKKGLFEMNETKYVLLIIALLLMCSVVLHRK